MYQLEYKILWNILNLFIFITLTSLLVFPPEWFFGSDIRLPERLTDKGIHFFVFTLLTIWVCGQLPSFIKVLMYISFYGIIIECIQYFSPDRTYELFDILANELGVILGILISFKLTNDWVIKIEDLITNLSSKY